MQLVSGTAVDAPMNVLVAWIMAIRASLAKVIVSVALCAAASPAFANSAVGGGGGIQSLIRVDQSEQYWMTSSRYYVYAKGRMAASMISPRRVLVTGYHPVEGFESEIAAEAQARNSNLAR